MPDIHLEDIGKDKGGASAKEVAEKIITDLKSSVTTDISSLNLDELPGAISDQLKGVSNIAWESGSQIMDKAKDAGVAVKEGIGKAGEKLKGLSDR